MYNGKKQRAIRAIANVALFTFCFVSNAFQVFFSSSTKAKNVTVNVYFVQNQSQYKLKVCAEFQIFLFFLFMFINKQIEETKNETAKKETPYL